MTMNVVFDNQSSVSGPGTSENKGADTHVDLAQLDARLRRLIEDIVADVFDVDALLLRRATRGKARIALARQVAMYIAHIGYGLTLTEVGRMFGRDRTTVAHACNVVEAKRDDVVFDGAVVLLEQIIRAINGSGVLESPIHGEAAAAGRFS